MKRDFAHAPSAPDGQAPPIDRVPDLAHVAEGVLAVTLATGANPWEAAAMAVQTAGWKSAMEAILSRLATDPFWTVRALSAAARSAVHSAKGRTAFLERLAQAGIHPLSVALGAVPMDRNFDPRAKDAIALATRLGVDPCLRAGIRYNGNTFALGEVPVPPSPKGPGHGALPLVEGVAQWPPALTIFPNSKTILAFERVPAWDLVLPANLRTDGHLSLVNTGLQTLPEGLQAELVVLKHNPRWNGAIPASAHIDRLFLDALFDGYISVTARGSRIMGGISPAGWRRFKALEAAFLASGSGPAIAVDQAKQAVLASYGKAQ
jgi:hypothetical protein